MPDIFAKFKWLDILLIILLFRMCYVALKTGLPIEIFKLLGTLAAIYLPLHYYSFVSAVLEHNVTFIQIKPGSIDFLIFIFLGLAGYMIFVGLRCIFFRFVKMETVPELSQWGGLLVGVLRSLLLIGLISFTLSISSIQYLNKSVKSSYLGSRVISVAPGTYSWLWQNIFSKFMTNERFNMKINELMESFNAK